MPKLRKTSSFGYRRRYTDRVTALVILCHPFDNSFCHAIADKLKAALESRGVSVTRHDLYAEGPDPVLTGAEIARRLSLDSQIQRYSSGVQEACLVAFVHPDWWSGPPALLKGWIERVFRPGVAYDWVGAEFEEKRHAPLLTRASALVFVTTDRPEGDPPRAIDLFWSDVCSYSGMTNAGIRVYHDVRHSNHRTRRRWLSEIEPMIDDAIAEAGEEKP